MLSVKQATQRILSGVPQLSGEEIAISEADGRVLAADVVARRVLPPYDNSAMDGFAMRAADLPGTLPIAGVVAAGDRPHSVTVAPGTAVRIMTGAPVPEGADTVVMREEADDRGETVAIELSPPPGAHVRAAGEDVAIGDVVLAAGTRLGAGEIGLCAALGCARVDVSRRPRVGILSTGDELVDVDVDPAPGQIVNSNSYALAAQVREAGGEPVQLGIAPDNREAIDEYLRRGLETDVLCTSGGVSVGDYDYVKPCLEQLGVKLDFWKVAMKPGKPLAYGIAPSGTLVFGLPGNPGSSMVVFELFVRSTLLLMQGATDAHRPRADVVLAVDYRKSAGRSHYVRASITRNGDELTATPNTRQGSGMLRSMISYDALIEVDAKLSDVPAGTRLPALLMRTV